MSKGKVNCYKEGDVPEGRHMPLVFEKNEEWW